MKSFTLLAASFLVAVAGSSFALTPEAQNLINFKQIASKQKTDWLNWMGKTSKAKYDLLAKEHDKWFSFGIENMKKFDAVTNPAEKSQLMQAKLKDAVALYEAQKNEMETFWKNVSEEARKMCDEQRAQLHKFKVSAGLIVEKPEVPMPMKETVEGMNLPGSNR